MLIKNIMKNPSLICKNHNNISIVPVTAHVAIDKACFYFNI
jgi:hypothetical protein